MPLNAITLLAPPTSGLALWLLATGCPEAEDDELSCASYDDTQVRENASVDLSIGIGVGAGVRVKAAAGAALESRHDWHASQAMRMQGRGIARAQHAGETVRPAFMHTLPKMHACMSPPIARGHRENCLGR
jgi:hypothetical protein